MKYLEIIISLVFIFLMLSLFSSIIMEFISTFFRMRASTLQQTIAKMLGANSIKEEIVKKFYETPIIKMLGEQNSAFFSKVNADNLPHTIDSKIFASVLLDSFKIDINKSIKDNSIVEKIDASDILAIDGKDYLKHLISKSKDDVEKLQSEIEKWYDAMMDRTITWYKRKTQYILIIIGILLAVIFNADSIRIITELNKNDKARMEIVKAATEYVKAHDSLAINTVDKNFDTLRSRIVIEYTNAISQSNDVLGWKNNDFITSYTCYTCVNFVISIIGFILTGFAISLGSTFWFDMLKKITNIKVLAQQDN